MITEDHGTREVTKCPACNGYGTVNRPPWVNGDSQMWTSNMTSYTCQKCYGVGLIAYVYKAGTGYLKV